MAICTTCNGQGRLITMALDGYPDDATILDCGDCGGNGGDDTDGPETPWYLVRDGYDPYLVCPDCSPGWLLRPRGEVVEAGRPQYGHRCHVCDRRRDEDGPS